MATVKKKVPLPFFFVAHHVNITEFIIVTVYLVKMMTCQYDLMSLHELDSQFIHVPLAPSCG